MITINDSKRIDPNNVYAEGTITSTADLEDLPEFARTHELQHGSAFYCQEDGEVYQINPDYSYKKMV